MRKLPAIALAGIAAALAGTAIAAAPKSHRMDVPLPDGSIAHIEYVGEVAPKVTIGAPQWAGIDADWAPFPAFSGFDRIFEEMNRQAADMMRQVPQGVARPGGTANVASFGGAMPSGAASYSVVSVSNGSSTCTRTTQVVPQGNGKPDKVVSSVSGDCGTNAAPAQPPAPAQSSAPIDQT